MLIAGIALASFAATLALISGRMELHHPAPPAVQPLAPPAPMPASATELATAQPAATQEAETADAPAPQRPPADGTDWQGRNRASVRSSRTR